MYSLSDLFKLKGYKVRIVTAEGEYEGIVGEISVTVNQVTLERVFIMPKREPVGTLHFFTFELKSCKIVQEPKDLPKKSSSLKESKGFVSNVIDYRTLTVDVHALKQNDKLSFVSTHYENGFQDFSDYFPHGSDDSGDDGVPPEEEEEEEFVLSLPKYLDIGLPLDWIVINEINYDFFCAIKHINQESVVAVSFEGQSIGRSGKLSLIGISTKFCTFLFDILVLQNEVFHKGLKGVFQNPQVQKVIHDCRQASDALFHQYQTSLVNIFDTQVADVFVNLHKSRNGKVHPSVTTLPKCIHRYLNLREEDIYPGEIDYHALKEAVDWMHRPVNNAMKEVAIKNVILLRELKSVLLERMLFSYTQAVGVYLRVLRNATAEELELNPSSPNHLPEALLMNGLHVIQCKEFTDPPLFLPNTSAFYKDSERNIFNLDLNNPEKTTSKRNSNIPSKPRKKRRSACNRPLRHHSAPLSSEGEEMANNERKRPKPHSNQLCQSISSEDKAGVVVKEENCTYQPKSVPDNNVIEQISHISELTLRDDHQTHSPESPAHDSLRCVHLVREDQPTTKLKDHSAERNFRPTISPSSIFEVKFKGQPNPQIASDTSRSVLDNVVLKKKGSISEVKLNDLPHSCESPISDSNLKCLWPMKNETSTKSKDHSQKSNFEDYTAKMVKIRYVPAGMKC